MSISYDVDKRSHANRANRLGQDTFDVVRNNIQLCINEKIPYSLSITISEDTIRNRGAILLEIMKLNPLTIPERTILKWSNDTPISLIIKYIFNSNYIIYSMKHKILFFCIVFCMAGIYTSAYAQTKDLLVEGTLKMYYLDNAGEGKIISQYRKTDWMNTCLAFVVELDKEVNVMPYLDKADTEWLDDSLQSAIMIVPEFKFTEKDFATKYANKKVRVKGSLYVPGGGWRNATAVVMRLKEIKPIDSVKSR